MIATPSTLLPLHWAELQRSAIAADVGAGNVASWGPGTDRHWEAERAELVAYARLQLQTASKTASGLPQAQPGFLADRLIRLDQRYRHLAAGGWRSLSDALPGLEPFDQWKPSSPRAKGRRDGRGNWEPLPGQSVRYEAQPQHPDGGGLLLPRVPLRCWELIADRQGLPRPDAAAQAAGFWPWALAHPSLQLVVCEGWKKSLAAVSAGWAAVALPGVQMGRRLGPDGSERLIEALQLLAPGRRWVIAFDAEAKPSTATKVAAAAGALARALRSAGGRVEVARLPLLPRHDKTGADDLLAAAGPEALERALADTGPRAVLPLQRPADVIAAAGAYLADAAPIPAPAVAPLVILTAGMGAGKTEGIASHVAPLAAAGVPLLMPSHRQALGQAAAERVGVPWRPLPGTDERWQGVAACWDSWRPSSALQLSPTGWAGAVLMADEWAQAVEHLLLSSGTTLAGYRAEVLRTAAEQLPRTLQIIAAEAGMPAWAVTLLEALTGRRAHVIDSAARPMAGRPLHSPEGFKQPQAAALAFKARWAELVAAGEPFLCWTSSQKGEFANSAQQLAALHRLRCPGALVDVLDSTTPELAAAVAADPDGWAERRTAEAQALGVPFALYCTPAISSGVSWARWRPAAVIAYAGGRVAPEHVAQALARVRCPEVPAYLYAPERCPGAALRVGSGATDPAQLIADLRAVADPLYGQLAAADAEGAWLAAWAELGAQRNRQRFSYRATISGLLEREGWELQAPGPEPCPAAGAVAAADLQAAAAAYRDAADQAVIGARPLTELEAAELAKRRRLEPLDQAALKRHRLAERWGLEGCPPTLELLEADRNGLRDQLRLGWLLTTPEALALVGAHDQAAIAALDPAGRPFAPDRLRVAIGQQISALQALGLPQLLERFAAGETIAATDAAVLALHVNATAHRGQLAQAAGLSPAALPTGTLRALLQACGWRLEQAGRIKARGTDRDAYTYRAHRLALPAGVDAEALAAAWIAELGAPIAGAKSSPIEILCRGEKSPTPAPPPQPPPIWRHLQARAVAIPWPSPPLKPRSVALAAA
ncbi:DUF3854 domain-containing protein [Cyanobium sp. BA20m-p-22]|uniref:DUF3854 domain-containing protein n=1 Tax=Cyanobium sp. BA20m-p-22 TaxID=2823704 RepID=UPI0020CD8875|nr:DUF3854 domain-containing protein [Cyanobium sp. BA20m-p-22]MCP9910245.1 DUF3854 domain-containing protein [Cyanobium sp. BA20m-p-22]